MNFAVQVVSPTDVSQSAPRSKRGATVVISAADSWGALSAIHIEALTGCEVDSFFKGASTTDDWRGRYWDLLKGAIRGAGSPALLYMSLGPEDVWIVPGFPQRTVPEAEIAIAELVNEIHAIRLIDIVHPSHDGNFDVFGANTSILNHPNRYEFVDLSDLDTVFFENDPLHLIPESYALRVETLWARSTLAQKFGTCGA